MTLNLKVLGEDAPLSACPGPCAQGIESLNPTGRHPPGCTRILNKRAAAQNKTLKHCVERAISSSVALEVTVDCNGHMVKAADGGVALPDVTIPVPGDVGFMYDGETRPTLIDLTTVGYPHDPAKRNVDPANVSEAAKLRGAPAVLAKTRGARFVAMGFSQIGRVGNSGAAEIRKLANAIDIGGRFLALWMASRQHSTSNSEWL